MIDEDVKQRIKELCDLVQLIGQYVPSLKRAGNQFKGCCPFHKEKTPSFVVYPDSQHFYCYGCQKGGDAFTFVMEHEGFEFPEALRYLGEQVGVDVDAEQRAQGGPAHFDSNRAQRGYGKNDLFKLHDDLTTHYQQLLFSDPGAQALAYCRERGLGDELMRQFRLGYAPNSFDYVKNWGKSQGCSYEMMMAAGVIKVKNAEDNPSRAYDMWRDRLMFPITNPQGKVIGFSGRVLDPEQKGGKYVNSPETPIFHKSNVLYGLSQSRDGIREKKYAIVCEGQMDTIACHAAGLNNVVAPQGTAFTEPQARLLKRYCDEVVICFDSDNAGVEATIKSIEPLIAVELNAKVAVLNQGDDPDSIVQRHGADALQKFMDEAVDFFEFLLNLEFSRNGNSPSGKSQTVRRFLHYVAKLSSPVVRSEYCRFAAERLGLSMQPVFDELKRMISQERRRNAFQTPASAEPIQEQGILQGTEAAGVSKAILEAEGQLLDLCLNHEPFARELEGKLPHERISRSPAGKALNDLLAYTAQGEWDLSKEIFSNDLAAHGCPELIRAINDPVFGSDRDPRDLRSCFDGCVKTLTEEFVALRVKKKEAELNSCTDPAKKREILTEVLELEKELRNYRKH
jgi:DNA primase